jgi:acyl-CoA synthetase (AMP-forming)/AMP-acid ligase II
MEVDEVLARIPGIELGIAVGFDNDACGQEVGAVVKVKDGAIVTEDAVLAFCRKHLPFTMRPKAVVLQTSIPVTPAGKYRRQECASLFAQWKATRFSEQA